MKKRFFFDLAALLAIAVGFFALLYFQDLDKVFMDNLKNTDVETLMDKAVYENDEYAGNQNPQVDKQEKLEKQV